MAATLHRGYFNEAMRFGFGQNSAATPTGRVILVMDDQRLRGAVAESLRRVLYEVTEASAAQGLREALGQLRDEPQECRTVAVVVDLRQPGHGAIEGAALLSEHGLYIPLIALSGHPKSSAALLHEHRVTAILQKPVDVNELRALIAGASR